MTSDQIFDKLAAVAKTVFRTPELRITRELSAKDVRQWDSIAHLDLIAMVERDFTIRIPTSKIAGLQSFGDLATLVEGLWRQKHEKPTNP